MKHFIVIAVVLGIMAMQGCAVMGKILADPPATKSGTIRIGMTADEVVKEWGKPYRSNQSIGIYGSHEQWVYVSRCYSGNYPQYYLYFDGGKLTSWQKIK